MEESSNPTEEASTSSSNKKTRKFVESSSSLEIEAPLPLEYRHVRHSERIIRDEVYETLANSVGTGLSVEESTKAAVLVGKCMFDMCWKEHHQGETIDIDTMPHNNKVLDKLKLIEAQSLSMVVDEMGAESKKGRIMTHAIDSTTKWRWDICLPGYTHWPKCPISSSTYYICGETTEDIALQTDFAFEVL